MTQSELKCTLLLAYAAHTQMHTLAPSLHRVSADVTQDSVALLHHRLRLGCVGLRIETRNYMYVCTYDSVEAEFVYVHC